ncbi:hypothetical protein AB205_0101070, partial [Aquarana catesbeiana]
MKAISTQFGHTNVWYCLHFVKVELCKFLSCVLFHGFKHACFNTKKAICTVKNKNVITKICWFVQKPFSNTHVNVNRLKHFLLNNVWLLLSVLNIIFWTKLVFTLKWGLFTKGKSTLHYKCTFSAVSSVLLQC